MFAFSNKGCGLMDGLMRVLVLLLFKMVTLDIIDGATVYPYELYNRNGQDYDCSKIRSYTFGPKTSCVSFKDLACRCFRYRVSGLWLHWVALDLEMGANPKGYMVQEIWRALARAKYVKWEYESTKRSWELQNLKEACVAALKEKHFLSEGFVDETNKSNLEQLEGLDKVFNIAAEDDIPTDVPEYLCCNITLDIFRDPVITPSGFTYERATILEHLKKKGFDNHLPFTMLINVFLQFQIGMVKLAVKDDG